MFFDYDTVADGKDPRQNIRLVRGDVDRGPLTTCFNVPYDPNSPQRRSTPT